MPTIDITPKGSFHVGRLGVGREASWPYVPSDTLFSAVIATLARTQAGTKNVLEPLRFNLTSVFPRIGEARLYPRPLVIIRCGEAQRDKLGKTLTKFVWCSRRIFDALRNGDDVTTWSDEKYFLQGGEVWMHPDDAPQSLRKDLDKFWSEEKPKDFNRTLKFWDSDPPVARVALHRTSHASNLFHSGRVQFAADCGLWFGLSSDTTDAEADVRRALDLLSDGGLGGLRSIGMGSFTYAWKPETLEQSSGELGVILSRYLPRDAQEITRTLKASGAAYQFIVVGGWCWDDQGQPWRRKQVRFVSEGSVIGWGEGLPGQVADVTPDKVGHFVNGHRVLRYGVAFPLAVKAEATA